MQLLTRVAGAALPSCSWKPNACEKTTSACRSFGEASRAEECDLRMMQGRNSVSVASYTLFTLLGISSCSAEQRRNRLTYHGTIMLHFP